MTSRKVRWRLNVAAGFCIGVSIFVFCYATFAYLRSRDKMKEGNTFRLPLAEKRIDSAAFRRDGSEVVEYDRVYRFVFANEHHELPDSFAVYLHADVAKVEFEETQPGDSVTFYAESNNEMCVTARSAQVAGRVEAIVGLVFLLMGLAMGTSFNQKTKTEALTPAPAETISAHTDSSPGSPGPASSAPIHAKTYPIDTTYRKYSPNQRWYIDIYWEVIKHEIANPVIFRNDGEEILSFANLGFELSGHEFNGDVVTLYLDAYPDRERFIAVLDLNRRDGSITHARRKTSIQTTFDTLGRDLVKFRNSS